MENILTYIKCGLAIIGGAISSALGGWDLSLSVLVTFVVFDFITGITVGFKEKKLNSKISFSGITRKILLFIPVAMAYSLDKLMGHDILRNLAIWFYIANEGLSIIENLGRAGIPIPSGLLSALEQLKNKGDQDE